MWERQFIEDHKNDNNGQGRQPTEEDWLDYQFSLQHHGTGPEGTWTSANWSAYGQVRKTLGDSLMSEIGKRTNSALLYTMVGETLRFFFGPNLWSELRDGPDGTLIVVTRIPIPPGAGGITLGEVIFLPLDGANSLPTVVHEYVHVLQYRLLGIDFKDAYDKAGGFYSWQNNSMEQQAIIIRRIYDANATWLPGPWLFPFAGGNLSW